MAPELDDELWNLIEPLLPRTTRRYRHPGRRRIDDRKVLSGILFVLSTGIAWQRLPQELGFGSGMTCWRRLRDWQRSLDSGNDLETSSGRVARCAAGSSHARKAHPRLASQCTDLANA